MSSLIFNKKKIESLNRRKLKYKMNAGIIVKDGKYFCVCCDARENVQLHFQ